MQSTDFLLFLEQFIHYMCSRCIINVPGHSIQDKTGGRHSHNGEILDLLDTVEPNSDRVLAAFHTWQNHSNPVNIQSSLASAYNKQIRSVPRSPVEWAAKSIMDNWNHSWLRHGLEQTELAVYNRRLPWPAPETRIPVGQAVLTAPEHNWFAVDLDRMPFQAFEEHPVEIHSGYSWCYTVGLLPMPWFNRYHGELYHPKDRDHWYARVSVPARYWVYLYRDFDQHTQEPQHQHQARDLMHSSGVPAIHITEYHRLVQLYRHLLNHHSTASCLKGSAQKSRLR